MEERINTAKSYVFALLQESLTKYVTSETGKVRMQSFFNKVAIQVSELKKLCEKTSQMKV